MGNFMRHIWTVHKRDFTPREYVEQSFNKVIEEYYIECAGSNGIMLLYDGDTDRGV
jgi:hypothetical protein